MLLNHHLRRIKLSMQGFMKNPRRLKIVWLNSEWIKVRKKQLPTISLLKGLYLKRSRRSTNRIPESHQLREQKDFTKHGQHVTKNLKISAGSRMLNINKQYPKTRTSQQINLNKARDTLTHHILTNFMRLTQKRREIGCGSQKRKSIKRLEIPSNPSSQQITSLRLYIAQ